MDIKWFPTLSAKRPPFCLRADFPFWLRSSEGIHGYGLLERLIAINDTSLRRTERVASGNRWRRLIMGNLIPPTGISTLVCPDVDGQLFVLLKIYLGNGKLCLILTMYITVILESFYQNMNIGASPSETVMLQLTPWGIFPWRLP